MNWLQRQAVQNPDALALEHGGRCWTYAGLHREAISMAGVLHHRGVGVEDRVALLLPNSADYVILLHALMQLGAVAIPMNNRLAQPELLEQLGMAQPKCVIVGGEQTPLTGHAGYSVFLLNDLFAPETGMPPPISGNPAESLQCILFTSGTTGRPKAVPLTYLNHEASARGSAVNLGVQQSDNWLCVLPLYHVGGLAVILRSVMYGTAMTLHPTFDEEELSKALRTCRITIVSLVPTMLKRLLEHDRMLRKENVPFLRAILLGGGPAASALIEEASKRGFPVLGTYGLTEAASQITTVPLSHLGMKAHTAGVPIDGARICVLDDVGNTLPTGTSGEIAIAGPMVFRGYQGAPELNRRQFQGEWFRTGDLGFIDEDEFLTVETRREDLILSGGEKVIPGEVETVLCNHPDVLETCVVGLADEEWGQRVVAAVVLRTGITWSTLEAHCRVHLAGYKIPRLWLKVERLPKTSSGKILRSRVRELFSGTGG